MARASHERILLGTTLPHTRLAATGALRVHHQLRQLVPRTSVPQPTPSIDEADALRGHVLALRRLAHHPPHQVVNQDKKSQLLEDPLDRRATQHTQTERLFE